VGGSSEHDNESVLQKMREIFRLAKEVLDSQEGLRYMKVS
jgi:hypothetical protein